MERDLDNKTAIITGGAKGIGYNIAERFLQNKAKVVILLDVDETSGCKAAEELQTNYGQGKAVYIKCDVMTDMEKVVEEIIGTYKTVDVLVNNAAWEKENSIKDTLALNTVALVEWTMKFLEHMRIDAGGSGGTIINVSSVLGFVSCPYVPFYNASKYAVIGFSKTVGHLHNYKTHGVRIIVLCPGFTRTTLMNFGEPRDDLPDEANELMRRSHWQDPDAVGDATVEMFRNADSGTVWVASGGKPIKPVLSLSAGKEKR